MVTPYNTKCTAAYLDTRGMILKFCHQVSPRRYIHVTMQQYVMYSKIFINLLSMETLILKQAYEKSLEGETFAFVALNHS